MISFRILAIALAATLALAAPATADFTDGDYHEVVLFNWDTTRLDVLVVPPVTTAPIPRGIAIDRSIDAWESGIQQLAEPWLADAMEINRYTLGKDMPPLDALADPEIIVVSAEVNPFLLFGIGASSDYFVCGLLDLFLADMMAGPSIGAPLDLAQAAPTALPPGWHQHPGSPWAVAHVHCSDTLQNVCFVVNTNFAYNKESQHRMYDLNAHEFGHCLGIGHVGDALDFSATTFPADDIMSYQHNPDQVHCVSSLNLRALEGSFARLLGRPHTEWVEPFEYVHMDPRDYTQVSCANPY